MSSGSAIASSKDDLAGTSEALQDWIASVSDWWVKCVMVLGPDPAGANDVRVLVAVYPDSYRAEASTLARSAAYGAAWRRAESPMAAFRNLGNAGHGDEQWAAPWMARGIRSLVRMDVPTAQNNGFEFFALSGRDMRDRADAAELTWSIMGVWPRIRSDVISRGYGISLREREVLSLLAKGTTAQAAADALGCTARTVTYHLTNVARKLAAHNKSGAIQRANSLGIL